MKFTRNPFASISIRNFLLTGSIALSFAMPTARATSFFWDSDTATTANQNGSGSWDTTNTNWISTTAGTGSNAAWTNSATLDTAFIGSTTAGAYTNTAVGGTITLATNITAFSVSMSSGQLAPYIIDGAGTFTLTATSIGNNNPANSLTINAVVAGAVGLNKINAGKVILNLANTYTGTTTFTAGTLSLNNAGALGNPANTLKFAGGTLQYTANNTVDYSSKIASTSTGVISLDTNGQDVTWASVLPSTSTGGLTKSGAGTLTLAPATANLYTGLTTVSGGILQVGTISAGSLGSGGLLFSNGGQLQGNGSFTRSFSNTGTPGTGLVAGINGGFAAVGGPLTVNFGNAGALVQLSNGSFRFGTNLVLGSAAANNKVTIVNPLDMGNSPRTITVNTGVGGDSAELQGAISNTGALAASQTLTKAGTGLLLLSGADTYSGGTAITAGTLQLGNAAALGFGGNQTIGTGVTTVANGATLDLNGAGTINEPISLNGAGIGGNGAMVNNSGTPVTVGSGIAGAQVALITGTGTGYTAAPTVTISGTGSGATATASLGVTAASFAVSGGSTVYTTAPNVNIGGGLGATATATLTAGSVTGITITGSGTGFTGTPTIGFSGGAMALSASNFTIAASTTVYSVAPTVTISAGGGTGATATAVLSGGATGTVTGISITNSGTGYTSAPTIAFAGGTVATAGTLPTGTGNFNTTAAGTGNALNFCVGGVAIIAPGTGYTGTPTYTFGSGGNNDAVPGTVTLSSVNLVTASSIGGSGNTTINAVVSETAAAALTKVGAGTLTLAGTNTYTGATSVSQGALIVNGSTAAGSTVTVDPATTLGGSGIINGTLTVHGTVAPGNSAGTLTVNNNVTVDGTYACQLDGAANADKLAVTGNLDINGATLAVSVLGGGAAGNYTIATYTGTRTGTFTISPPLPAGYTVDYSTANQINLISAAVPDYTAWANSFGLQSPWLGINPALNGTPAADPDGDGLTNQQEYAFGLTPTSGSSVNPITVQLNKTTGKFSYTRRATPATTGLVYTVKTSPDLVTWTADVTASHTVTATTGGVETVEVTLSGLPLSAPNLFVRVQAQ